MNELQKSIEEAFDYRGNVTLQFKAGPAIECFLFNREFDNAKLDKSNFVEVFLAEDGRKKTFNIADLKAVELTGKDFAKGKSYEEWIKKQEAKLAS